MLDIDEMFHLGDIGFLLVSISFLSLSSEMDVSGYALLGRGSLTGKGRRLH